MTSDVKRAALIADIAMFERSDLSISMGNASPEVRRDADVVTGSNGKDGFAVERFISAVRTSRLSSPEQRSPHG